MQEQTRQSMASSERVDWGTPRVVLDPLEAFGGIELDPCANLRSVVEPKKGIYLPDDGLVASWSDLVQPEYGDTISAWGEPYYSPPGVAFINPPYGRAVKKWMEKCKEEAANGCEIVSLVAARVDTKWFHENIFASAQAVCFWKGRIKFIDLSTGQAGDPAFFPSAVVYWGPRANLFEKVYATKGKVIRLNPLVDWGKYEQMGG